MAYKNLVNQSGLPLNIELVTRLGPDPSQSGASVLASLPPGATQQVQYGDPSNPYLNGLVVSSSANGQFSSGSHIATARGSNWDNLLNTNNTLIFSGPGGMNVGGSNM